MTQASTFGTFSFERVRPCTDKLYHFKHPSCCNETEYLNWLNLVLKPLKDFEEAHPFPRFKKVQPCDLVKTSDHVDGPSCCNAQAYDAYKRWYNKVVDGPKKKLFQLEPISPKKNKKSVKN